MNANRLSIALAATNLVLLGALAVSKAEAQNAVQPVVRAQLIELVDSAGKLRGQLKADAGGEVTFRMYDAGGQIRTEFGANADGSGVAFMDNVTYPGVRIFAGKESGGQRNGSNITLAMKSGKQNIIKP